MVERLASKASMLRQQKYKENTVLFLVFIFLIQMVMPTVNAEGLDGLDICTDLNGGFCDTVYSEDDGSSQVSWIEGIYHINMIDTGSMQFVATWEIYEYDRTPLGFTGTLAETALENDGIFSDMAFQGTERIEFVLGTGDVENTTAVLNKRFIIKVH